MNAIISIPPFYILSYLYSYFLVSDKKIFKLQRGLISSKNKLLNITPTMIILIVMKTLDFVNIALKISS